MTPWSPDLPAAGLLGTAYAVLMARKHHPREALREIRKEVRAAWEKAAEPEEQPEPGLTVPVGIWKHAEGPLYLVIGLASDSNNEGPRDELQVVYVSLEAQGRTSWPMHVRSLPEFLERFTPEA